MTPTPASDALSGAPFSYWVGMTMDPRVAPDALAEFNRFYSTTHVHEVIAAHPGFVSAHRFELEAEANGPRYLAIYTMADEAAAVRYLQDNERPWLHRRKYSPWPAARRRAKTVWRMLWRRIASTGTLEGPSGSLALLATNPPADLVVLPGYSCATSLELYRGFDPPESDVPRWCVLHEAAGDPGPTDDAADDGQEVVWRLRYRRIAVPE